MNEVKKPQNKAVFRFWLSWLSEYRMQVMGCCAIGVILCHASLSVSAVALPQVIKLLFGLGNQGVDVFFLLSGIGIYYSLQRGDKLGKWCLKRLCAVGISYLLIAVPFYAWYVADFGGNVLDFFSHLSMIGFWIENFGAWYLAVLIPLYIVAPFVGKFIEGRKHRTAVAWLIVISVFVICVIGKGFSTGVLNNVFSRFRHSAAFFVGYGLGKAVQDKRSVSWWICPAFAVLFLLLTRLPNRFGFAYLVLYIPLAMLLCAVASVAHKHVRWLDKVLCFCGKRSLELYLTNIFLPFVLRALPIWDAAWNTGNYAFYAIVIALGVTLSQVVYMVRVRIQKRLVG